MTEIDGSAPPEPRSGATLEFHGPLSADRAARLVRLLASASPATVFDVGCGRAELMLRILAAAPTGRGVGVDTNAPDIAVALANATARGLADRVAFAEGPASDHLVNADLVLNVGAYHAFGTTKEALTTLRSLVNPGGRLLFGAEFWQRPPTAGELASMWPGSTADDCTDIAGLVDLAIAAGFRPLRIETATQGEWEEFESGYALDRELWLLSNPDHPRAAEVRARLDETRDIWLRGYRNVLGFAYLILGVPAMP